MFKAFGSNSIVLSEIQNMVAKEIGVECGELIWLSESAHIYGSYFKEIEGFINYIEKNPNPKDRAFTTQYCIPMFIDGCDELLAEKGMPEDKKIKIRQRKEELLKQQNVY